MENVQQVSPAGNGTHFERVRAIEDRFRRYGELNYAEAKKLHEDLSDHGRLVRSVLRHCGKRPPRLAGLVSRCNDPTCAACAELARMLAPPAAPFVFNDGGRAAAGYTRRPKRGDCVVRAIAIALEMPYTQVRDELNELAATGNDAAEYGVWDHIWKQYLKDHGWTWTPTMGIGTGCKVHLRAEELPSGRIIARVSVHLVAMIDGVIHDTHDPTRDGTRCVYGYFSAVTAS